MLPNKWWCALCGSWLIDNTQIQTQETGQYTDAAGDLIAAHDIMLAANGKKGRKDHGLLSLAAAGGSAMGSIDWRKAAVGGKKDLRSRLTAVIRGDK